METLDRSREITAELDDGTTVTGKLFFNRSRKGRFKVFYNGCAGNDGRNDYTNFDQIESNAILLLKQMAA